MQVIRTTAEMLASVEAARCSGETVGLVPTMGALHEGHLALVHEASRRATNVVVSIFVNPTQFGPGEDFDRYPRTLEEDLGKLRSMGVVQTVFAPTVEEMYPSGAKTHVHVGVLGAHLCGAHRPGHFDGVTTVVARLFSICRPHVAVFGRKDAQQFVILRRLAKDLFPDVELVGVETVREEDGLALSSRNRYLAPEARQQAVALSRAVMRARDMILAGERETERVVAAMTDEIDAAPLGRLQYAEVVDTETLQPVQRLDAISEVLVAVAAHFEGARLIDNQFVSVPSAG